MATPRTFRFEQWQLEATSEEEYFRLMKEHYEERYRGLSTPILSRDALLALPPPKWALRNLITQDGFTLVHGKPGSGKSFLAMEWAYVLGHESLDNWLGMKRDRRYKPMYVYTEGLAALQNRMRAWEMENGVIAPDIVIVRDAVKLNPPKGVSEQLAALEKLYVDQECDILFVDTLANTFSGNENQQEDANRYMAALKQFQRYGPVVVIHHNQREKNEYRGSSVFEGAADTMVSMERNAHGIFILKVEKQKDGDMGFMMELVQNKHEWPKVPEDEWGHNPEDTYGSVAFASAAGASEKRMTGTQREIYEMVLNAGGEMPLAELARESKRDKKNVKRMVKERIPTLELFSEPGNNRVMVRVVQAEEPERF